MRAYEAEIAVLGSGFAGSLTALILHKLDRRVVLIDRDTHPRFAIGESSTPIANMVLRDLAERYDLPRIAPLTKFGSWQQTYPRLACGIKRGFSYFKHDAGQPFQARADHNNELLVTASADDEHSDTQWFRADIDRFLADEARDAGIPLLDGLPVEQLEHKAGDWTIGGMRNGQPTTVAAQFVIDATGEAGMVPRALGIGAASRAAGVHSRAIYAHFGAVRSWHEMLAQYGGHTSDHPFHCDHAAQHHILDGAWMWLLRFNNGFTSAGLVLDSTRYPLEPRTAVADEWRQWLTRYPSVASLFGDAAIVDPPGRLLRTVRLQRRWQRIVGPDWAALPHTAGFVDPLHSTGIAHTLCGVERLVGILEQPLAAESLVSGLRDYERIVFQELDLIDQLVSGCFATFDCFPLLAAYSMLYFAAATTYERQRTAGDRPSAFLGADGADWRETVTRLRLSLAEITRQASSPSSAAARDYARNVAAAIEPYNHVGLCDPHARNMYRYTAPQ